MIPLRSGVVIAGKYALDRVLAAGGMGSIWVARHRELDVDITIKFMAPTLVQSPEMRARFEREARVAARLRSQHVVQILDYGVEDGTPYIAMELLTGESLADRLKREGRLPLSAVGPLLIQICKALRTAHEAGLVHRDLKPGNIFLAVKDDDEVVKVLDFGIAKVTDASTEAQDGTGTGVILGSAHYMSPEQIRSSRQVDHRSDLWSLGVILYRVLTGNLPFPGSVVGDVLVRVCTEPCPSPSRVVSDLPPLLDEFFARALEKDVERRFQSAKDVAEAFSAMALGEPQQGAQISVTARESGAWQPSVAPLEPTAPLPTPMRSPMSSAADGLTFAAPPLSDASVGTFQAVTKPPPPESAALPKSRPAPTRPPAVSPAILIMIAVLVLSGILAVILAIRWRSDDRESSAGAATPVGSSLPALESPVIPNAASSQLGVGNEPPAARGTEASAPQRASPTGAASSVSTASSTSVAPIATDAATEKRGPSNPTKKPPVKPQFSGPMEEKL